MHLQLLLTAQSIGSLVHVAEPMPTHFGGQTYKGSAGIKRGDGLYIIIARGT